MAGRHSLASCPPLPGFAMLVRVFAVVVVATIGAGLAAGGWFAGRGVLQARLQDRSVTVKGVAEHEAKAGLAVWPLRFSLAAGDLGEGKGRIDAQTQMLREFLTARGFTADELSAPRLDVQDTVAQAWSSGQRAAGLRFVLTQNIVLRSARVDAVDALQADLGALVERGIVFEQHGGPSFVFTAEQLNAVKPELIRQAAQAARAAADEFAATSGARVGAIRRANQGVIAVQARDENPEASENRSVAKRIRAVATLDYFLVD